MKIVKFEEIKYQIGEITENGVELAEEYGNPLFDTIKDAEEFIKNELNEKYYIIYKVKLTREIVKEIKQMPSPCTGGNKAGHHTIGYTKPFIFCGGCGYKLRRTNGWETKYVLVKPLEQEPDSVKLLSVLKQMKPKVSNN